MPEIKLVLPRPHAGQRRIRREAKRFNVINCGRRFGKTVMGNDVLIGPALEGYSVAWASPAHKMRERLSCLIGEERTESKWSGAAPCCVGVKRIGVPFYENQFQTTLLIFS